MACAIAGLCFAALCASSARAHDIRFGVAHEPYPPFEYKDNNSGDWAGFEIDLMRAICDRMKASCRIVETPWAGIIPALNQGKFDVIWSSMSITEKRAKTIAFTDRIYRVPGVVIGRKDAPVSIDFANPLSVKGKLIGAEEGTTHMNFVQKFFGSTAIIKPYRSGSDVEFGLVNGQVDLAVTDEIWGSEILQTPDGKDLEFKAVLPWDSTLGQGVAGAVRKTDKELLASLTAAFEAIRTDGTYQKLAQRYFNFDPYGN